MSKGCGFHNVRIDASQGFRCVRLLVQQLFGQSSANLGYFKGMSKPIVERLSFRRRYYLGDPT